MRHLVLLAGVAALAVSAPALAKDNGRGEHGRGAHADRQGGGHDRAGRGGGREREVRTNHRGGGETRAGRGGGREREVRADRGRGRDARPLDDRQRNVERAILDERRVVRQARMENGRIEPRRVAGDRGEDRRDWNGWATRPTRARARFIDDNVRFRTVEYRPAGSRRIGCPPGLARQNVYCLPPGQLRRAQRIGQPLAISGWDYNVPARYRYRFVDGDRYFYRYGNDGAVYRFNRGTSLVSSVIPLTSTGLMFGEPLPLGYEVYNVPLAYRPFYPDTADYLYRYDDNAIYRVNSDNMLVEGIAALLTSGAGGLGGLGIGDMLPSGYDAYNVPLDYRDTYFDTDESMYRYADGSIYEVDPQTRLIESVISLLV